MKEMLQLSATQIGHKISLGEVCPVDLIEAYIEKINSYPKSNTIFTTIMVQKALKQAYEAKDRVKTNNRISILDGVPISWKDICDIEGYPSEAGSALLRGRVPNHNAEVIKNATQSGLISLSKTHMTELAFSGLGVNPITKTPNNAIDSKLAPGGSSSGAAVGVALNLVAGSIGSDTGGSVRVPAAWNNLVGLKTTHGLVSLNGVLPLCPKFDTIGPIVKSVEDAANLLAAIIPNKRCEIQNDNAEQKRLAVIETIFLDNLDNTINTVFEKGLELLTNHGFQITRIKSSIISDALALSSLVFSPEAYGTWEHLIETNPKKMYQPILERFRSGRSISGPEYVKAWQKLEKLRYYYIELVKKFDAILAPTTATLPPKIDALLANNNYFSEMNLLALRNTRVANLLGLPALTIPTSTNFCGLMIMGRSFEETSLLKLGKSIENIIKG